MTNPLTRTLTITASVALAAALIIGLMKYANTGDPPWFAPWSSMAMQHVASNLGPSPAHRTAPPADAQDNPLPELPDLHVHAIAYEAGNAETVIRHLIADQGGYTSGDKYSNRKTKVIEASINQTTYRHIQRLGNLSPRDQAARNLWAASPPPAIDRAPLSDVRILLHAKQPTIQFGVFVPFLLLAPLSITMLIMGTQMLPASRPVTAPARKRRRRIAERQNPSTRNG